MDYTSLERVLSALGGEAHTDDALIEERITAASREFDRQITGTPTGADYFANGEVAGEILTGWITADGLVRAFPHKAIVNSVSAFAYRMSPLDSWIDVDTTYLVIKGNQVEAWVNALALRRAEGIQVCISYDGGFGETLAELPADVVEAVTVLTARFYREAKTGLADSIGVADLGMLMYTKALPVRVSDVISQYRRVVPW